MISPTPRAIWLMAAGAPLILVTVLFAPGLWAMAGVWVALILGLMLLDSVLAARLAALEIELDPPTLLYIDASDPVDVIFTFTRGPLPQRLEVRLEGNELLEQKPSKGLRGWHDRSRPYAFVLTPVRRGAAKLTHLWARWNGPLGLVQKRRIETLDIEIPVTPNTRWVKEEAIRLYTRDAQFGIKMQIERGDGSEFDALREFTAGMDKRAIDWKHSARHRVLLAKEFRTERNHNIVFAFDTGRLMSEPLGGVPKLDRAINAALLLAYVSLRSGDRTALFGFGARPGLATHSLNGTAAFPHLQHLAAGLGYSTEEANYTLALTDLASRQTRRSLIILFTDFVDTISAELMLENVKRLTAKHLVLFATFNDAALEGMVDTSPETTTDISRAVIADGLLQERELVFRRLARLGAHVIETSPEQFGSQLVSRYLDIKRKELL